MNGFLKRTVLLLNILVKRKLKSQVKGEKKIGNRFTMDRVALEKPKHVPPSPYTRGLIQGAFTKTLGGDDWAG